MGEHVDIADGERHEPKGASTAAVDTVYVSDGASSGSWRKVNADEVVVADSGALFTATEVEAALAEIRTGEAGGWGHYEDDGVSTLSLSTTAAKLSINGLGSATEEDYLPLAIRGSDSLWDTVGDKIDSISVGDAFTVRLDLPVSNKATTPTLIKVEADVSGLGTPTTVAVEKWGNIAHSATTTLSMVIPLFADSNFNTNGCQFFLSTDVGTCDVIAPAIFIQRTGNGNL